MSVNPITPPLADRYLVNWLKRRLGADRQGNRGRLIYATGSVNADDKYKSKPIGYQPDVLAYLDGDVHHIYGSWLRGTLGLTYVLAFDLDQPEHHAQHQSYMEQLAAAGVPSIYWLRGMNGRERGHLELYFDRPVDPDRAYAWSISLCPKLSGVTECFPVGEKHFNALSWPLYQRIENQVQPCLPLAQICVGEAVQGNVKDRQQLAWLIHHATTEATLVESFNMPVVAQEKSLASCQNKAQRNDVARLSTSDVITLVLAEFHEMHSWDEVTAQWGGIQNGRFRNGERGERTASVVIDRDGRYACDYGDIGGQYPRKLDKYEVWCRANHINKKVDLDERCRAYRRRLSNEA